MAQKIDGLAKLLNIPNYTPASQHHSNSSERGFSSEQGNIVLTPEDVELCQTAYSTLLSKISSLETELTQSRTELTQSREDAKNAYTDDVTGASTRAVLWPMIDKSVSLYKRDSKNQTCIFILDIDNFKKFNDTYGHDIGDVVLKTLTSITKGVLRDSDTFVRYGGEEFVGLLDNTTPEQAYEIVERLRKEIGGYILNPMATNGTQIPPVKISIGLTYLLEGDVDIYDAAIDKKIPLNERFIPLIKRADIALYDSKKIRDMTTCNPPLKDTVSNSSITHSTYATTGPT